MISAQYIVKRRSRRRQRFVKARISGISEACKEVPSQPTKAFKGFLDLLANNDIRAEITSYLDTKDFLSLASTTFSLRQDLRPERWDLNRKLSRFFRDPLALRNLQARTNALISGPFALGFAEGKMWKDSYPVIWVHREHRDGWLEYLDAEGYIAQKEPSIVNQFRTEYSDATDSTFNASCERPGYGTVELHIHFTTFNAFAALIWMTELTSQCNFITWNKAYVMFAKATLQAHNTFPVNTHRLEELGAVLSFQDKIGWATYDFVPRWYRHQLGESILGGSNRFPGDDHCLSIPLDTRGIKPGSLNYENCDFGITTHNKQRIVLFTAPMSHPLLKHNYASSLRCGAHFGKFALVRETRLDSILPYELLKHGETACPPGVPYPLIDSSLHDSVTALDERWEPASSWTPPAEWSYVDHCLAEWIDEVRREDTKGASESKELRIIGQ